MTARRRPATRASSSRTTTQPSRPSRATPREERISREIDRRRSSILEVARDILSGEGGISGFTMERVADEAGYARTAIYRYFPSKEELIVELAIETLELRVELYRRVVRFEARPRERLVAFGEVTSMLYPRHVMPHIFALAQTLREKTREDLQERLRALEQEEEDLNLEVARQAVANGDLSLSHGMTIEETVVGLDALVQGLFERVGSQRLRGGVGDPRIVLRRMGSWLLDGLGWRPLSTEWDYHATMNRIYDELFTPQVLAELGVLDLAEARSRSSARVVAERR